MVNKKLLTPALIQKTFSPPSLNKKSSKTELRLTLQNLPFTIDCTNFIN